MHLQAICSETIPVLAASINHQDFMSSSAQGQDSSDGVCNAFLLIQRLKLKKKR